MAKKVEEKKEVVKKEETTAALTVGASDGAWGSEDIGSDDITIPKILLMQPMSELVTDGIAKIGEFRSSLEKDKKLGDAETPLEVITFGSFKTWIEFKDGEYLATKKFTPENAELPLEEVAEDGAIITRDKVLNFYCLVPKDVTNNEAFPFVLSCRRTSYNAGKTIATHIKKLQMFKKPSAAKVFTLKSNKETNDKGTFFTIQVDVGRDSTKTELETAYEWYKLLAKSKVKVDDSDLGPTAATEAADTPLKPVHPQQPSSVTV